MPAVITHNYHWIITDVSVISSRLQRVGTLVKEDRIDEIKYSPPVLYLLQPPKGHMKYMDLRRNRAIIETYYNTVVLNCKRNTLRSYLYFLSDIYVLIIYESEILALTYDILSISSRIHFYSECVSLNYHRSLSLFPARTAFHAI